MERALLVGVGLKSEARLMASSLAELRSLTETAGGRVAGEFSQALVRYHAGTLIGSGKISEIGHAVGALKAATVIFDHELSPAQQKHLEAALKAKVIDRTRLILDIFARRARTSEGRLQVELAQLSYLLPRLTGAWRAYSQQVGGIGTRGPGERQLEYERRHIQYRILHLRRELEKVRAGRSLRRERRLAVPVPQVALIGYTNVGKSTLLNVLTRGAAKVPHAATQSHTPPGPRRSRDVYADDKLFATLDPTSRRVRLPEGGWAVATDTVGFIQRLPTTLVAAFRSTLEEVLHADCLLHVCDAAHPDREAQDLSVDETLAELKAEAVPRVRVYNKADLLGAQERRAWERKHPDKLLISAATGEGLEEALRRVTQALSRRWEERKIELPVGDGHLFGEIYRNAQVLSEQAHGNLVRLRVRVTPENWRRIKEKLKSDPGF